MGFLNIPEVVGKVGQETPQKVHCDSNVRPIKTEEITRKGNQLGLKEVEFHKVAEKMGNKSTA